MTFICTERPKNLCDSLYYDIPFVAVVWYQTWSISEICRGTRDQIANIHLIIEKAKEFQKSTYFCFIDYTKAFDCVDHNKLWKILQEMGIADYLTCLLGNLYAGQEATVRTGHATTGWFQIGKGLHQGCILSPCLFNLYSESISCEMAG